MDNIIKNKLKKIWNPIFNKFNIVWQNKKIINKKNTKNVNKSRGKPTKPRDPKLCECNNLIENKIRKIM
jgi:hypothetical protein